MKASLILDGRTINFHVNVEKREDGSMGPPLYLEVEGVSVKLAGVSDEQAFYVAKK